MLARKHELAILETSPPFRSPCKSF